MIRMVSRLPKRDVVEKRICPNVGSRAILILAAFALVNINDIVPVPVPHAELFDGRLLALAVDPRCVIPSRILVDHAARIALVVLMPVYVNVLADTRATFVFHIKS